jgi:hypothetical protein
MPSRGVLEILPWIWPRGGDIRPEKPLYQAELAVMVKGGVVIAAFGAAGIECGEPDRQRR